MLALPNAALSEATSAPASLGAMVAEAAMPLTVLGATASGVDAAVDGPKSTIMRRILSGKVEGPSR